MMKTCKLCNKKFNISLKSLTRKKIFCSYLCQQEYWKITRNKTGKSNKDSRMFGQNARTIHLTEKQLELCYGTLLGDASITPRPNGMCRIKITHCSRQREYLEWKMSLLDNFIAQKQLTTEYPGEKSFNKNSPPCFSFSTVVHQDFNYLYSIFYKPNRKKRKKVITIKNLNLLSIFSIFIWYLDDGTITHDNVIRFATNSFSLSEHKTIKKWFWHKFKIKTTINFSNFHNSYFLSINVENSKKLMNSFMPYKNIIPSCMLYKLKQL